MDRHDLYNACVQSPTQLVPFLRAIAGEGAHALGEDFCATGEIAKEWVRVVPGGRGVGVDHDAALIERARRDAPRNAVFECADVMDAREPVDLVFVGNFSIGEIHERDALVAYLRHARGRLDASPAGLFVCDTYGGESAYCIGSVERMHPAPADRSGNRPGVPPAGARIRYTWEQREADPLTGRVVNALHFRVEHGRDVLEEHTDAFVYHWRLWSVPELRDAMRDAGFVRTAVYAKLADAVDADGNAYVSPVESPDELDESFIVCVAAWAH
ncbi:MAG: hypothetical protein RBS39_00490 [Phycisphaerales bacterium]|jgi:PAS domain-containing protein|nr:hypothetical protein [Phycisphaerales bacterium]